MIGATLLFNKFVNELLNRKMAPGFNIFYIITGATLLFNKFINELLNRKMAPGFSILY